MEFKKLTPNFSVKNVKESVTFYQNFLGFELEIAVPRGANSIEKEILDVKEYSAAMMKKDDVFVMFMEHDNSGKDIHASNVSVNGASVLFYFDVSDIDKFYNGLKGKVEIEKEIITTWYGMREFTIKDCNGYVLAFGERESR